MSLKDTAMVYHVSDSGFNALPHKGKKEKNIFTIIFIKHQPIVLLYTRISCVDHNNKNYLVIILKISKATNKLKNNASIKAGILAKERRCGHVHLQVVIDCTGPLNPNSLYLVTSMRNQDKELCGSIPDILEDAKIKSIILKD